MPELEAAAFQVRALIFIIAGTWPTCTWHFD